MTSRPTASLPAAARPPIAGLAALPARLGLTWSDAAALTTVLLWGANTPVTKSLMTVAQPLAVTFVRAALSSLVFALVLGWSGRWRLPGPRDRLRVLGVGLFGLSANAVLYAEGLHRTTASHSGLIGTITPLMVFVLSHVLGLLRIRARDLLGLALGFSGAALIIGAPALLAGGESGGASLLGDLFTAGSAVTWGLWMLLAAPLVRRYGTLPVTAWVTSLSALGLAPRAVPELLAQDWSQAPPAVFVGLLYSGVIAGAGGALLWYGAVGKLGAAHTLVYSNLQAFLVVLLAGLTLGERVEWIALVGGVAVIAGVLLTRRSRPPRSSEPAHPGELPPRSSEPPPGRGAGTAAPAR